MGCTAPKDSTRVGRDSQPSWCFHLPPYQNTRPPHCCAPAGLHILLSLRQLVPGHPTILTSSQLPLPLPQLPPRMAATGQTLPALSLALHKPGLAHPHQCCSSCSQAGSFLNQDSSFWQKLPASDPDLIPGCLRAGCDPAGQDSPSAFCDNRALFRNCTKRSETQCINSSVTGAFHKRWFSKSLLLLEMTKSCKKYQLSFEIKKICS